MPSRPSLAPLVSVCLCGSLRHSAPRPPPILPYPSLLYPALPCPALPTLSPPVLLANSSSSLARLSFLLSWVTSFSCLLVFWHPPLSASSSFIPSVNPVCVLGQPCRSPCITLSYPVSLHILVTLYQPPPPPPYTFSTYCSSQFAPTLTPTHSPAHPSPIPIHTHALRKLFITLAEISLAGGLHGDGNVCDAASPSECQALAAAALFLLRIPQREKIDSKVEMIELGIHGSSP